MNINRNSTLRFSDRVDNYIKYRPGYPWEMLKLLKEEGILNDSSVIADIGSGTGILSEMFLRSGNKVFAVEPNKDMREAAERLLNNYKNFHSIDGTAEATTLGNHSVDLVTAGQAFHWFNVDESKNEFKRILKVDGYVVLVWNSRKNDSSEFMREFDELLQKWSIDYREVNHKNIDGNIIGRFYSPRSYSLQKFDNYQLFDLEGLKGRVLSASYAPAEGHPNHEPMMKALEELFKRFSEDGSVRFEYETELYSGKV